MQPDIGQWSTEKICSLMHGPNYNKSLANLTLSDFNLYQR